MKFHVKTRALKENKTKKAKVSRFSDEYVTEREHLFALLVAWPLLWIFVFFLLCKLGVFCVTDLFGKKRYSITQHLDLKGDNLVLSQANTVDLSQFHDEYIAGEGLQLENDNTFKLEETGVNPGTYGDISHVPVVTVDRYGRIVDISTVAVSGGQTGPQISINNMFGPQFTIVGTQNQVNVQSAGNTITLGLPQDIHNNATPLFGSLYLTHDLHLGGIIYDSNDTPGSVNQLLVSTGTGVEWQDIGAVVGDDQTLTWDDTTYDLTIEDGNTVNLGALNLWQQNPIGGYYTTDVLEPRSNNVQRWLLEHTAWGLTELQVRNDDNTNNYSGAVLTLKGSGPDYTNNMFFAKLGDSYYVPSWAGKGVVSTDQPLIIASVKSNDPAHPNNTPYIMFQTGGYYTAPEDKMILDSEGRLGIGDFSPVEKLSVAGNIALTDSGTARIYSQSHELEIGTNSNDVRIYSDNIVHMAVDPSGNLRGRVYVGTNSDPTSIPGNENKLFVILSDSDKYAPLVSVRYSNTIAGPVALYYKARGHLNSPQTVQAGDVLGGYNSLGYNGGGSTGWQLSAQLRHRVYDVINGNVVPYVEFKHRQPDGAYIDVARMLYDGRFGIGNTDPNYTLDLTPVNGTPVAINIRKFNQETGMIRFEDTSAYQNAVQIRAPFDVATTYTLTLPHQQGASYNVMYNDGSGNLAWDTVEHLLSIGVGDHAVLYSNGTNIVGDSDAFYWDYDNHRLGINLDGDVPNSQLNVRMTERAGAVFWDDSNGNYAKLMVAGMCNTDPFNCTRVQIDNSSIKGTYYNDERWSIGRDEFGSANAGLRLNHRNGIWASGYDLHLRTNDIDAINVQTYGGVRYIYTDSQFDVGIGTNTPSAKLQVGEDGDGTYALANAWQTFSDARLKTNIRPVDNALSKVLSLNGVYYSWKTNPNSHEVGFIAQNVQEVLPEVVKKTKDGYLTLDYSKMTPLLVEAIKEQQEQIGLNTKKVNEFDTVLFGLEQEASEEQTEREEIIKRLENGVLKAFNLVANKTLEILKDVIFKAKVVFEQRVLFNDKDMTGTVIIDTGVSEAYIEFENAFESTPQVYLTAYSEVSSPYYVADVTEKGFTIKFKEPLESKVTIKWLAISGQDRSVYVVNSNNSSDTTDGNQEQSETETPEDNNQDASDTQSQDNTNSGSEQSMDDLNSATDSGSDDSSESSAVESN